MADKPIVIRAKYTKGVTKVRVLISHPMIGYNDIDNNNHNTRPHFIQSISCSIDGKRIMSVQCGNYVGKDPFIAFEYEGGNKGVVVRVAWVDNWGERGSTETVID